MRPGARKALVLSGALAGVALACAAATYLAAALFLIANKTDPSRARLDSIAQYWAAYHGDPRQLKKLKGSAVISGFLCFVVAPFSIWSASQKKRPLHGAARFATQGEIRKAGLLGKRGILVGKHQGKFLTLSGELFVLLAAPTRSGKGVGIVIPNLLNFPDSVMVLDIKGENFAATSGFRAKHGQEVYAFRPFAEDGRTHRINPLRDVRRDVRFRVGDLQAIATVHYPTSTKAEGSGTEKFFNEKARDLFLGLALYVLESPELPFTLGEMLRQSSGKGKPIKEYLQGVIASRDKAGTPLSDDCVEALDRFLINSDNTLSGIISTFNAPLALFADPLVDAATSSSDFSLGDVRSRRMTIYIVIPPGRLAVSGLLINLLFSQLMELNTRETPKDNPALRYSCLLLMDEFTAMGRVGVLEKGVAFFAGYNLRFLTVIQSMSQLVSTYSVKEAETFISNHGLQIMFPPQVQNDAEEYSKMLGTYTEKAESRGRSRRAMDGQGTTTSTNVSDQKRSLMMPQELRELDQSKEIVLLQNSKPILCDKIVYYTDPALMKRVLPPLTLPVVDLDVHLARVQGRKRPMNAGELVAGVDLNRLAHNIDDLPPLSVGASAEEVTAFVNEFFDALDVAPSSLGPGAINAVEEGGPPESEDRRSEIAETRMIDLAQLER